MTDLIERFPDILPMEKVRVSDEEHVYEVQQDANGNRIEKQQYILNKSPFLELEGVVGTVNGDQYEFVRGTDFSVEDTDNDGRNDAIDFSAGGKNPDDNTTFTVSYVAKSIILRYVGSYEDEFHRFRDDIEEVIDSHYVDTASESGYIDDFEDEEIVEYTFQSGTPANAFVQRVTSFHGDWSLQMQSPSAGTPVRILSMTGLPRYPQRGDTFEFYYKFSNTDDVGHFDFLYSETSSGTKQYYRITIDDNNNDFVLTKQPNGNKSDSSTVSLGQYQGDWIKVVVDVEPLGDITAKLLDSNGSNLTSVTITDSAYTDGGIRWSAENAGGSTNLYFDAAKVTQRVSGDLDRVGAFFGELGKRRGRDDSEYKTFLRSIVKSFSGRGTIDGIKFAVASALDIDPSQITITEDFQNNEYTVKLSQPFPPHQLQTLVELADLADPSGVKFANVTYGINTEGVGVDESLSITSGVSASDGSGIDDAVGVNGNKVSSSETVAADDTSTETTRSANDFRWGEQATSPSQPAGDSWGGFDWDNSDWTESPTVQSTITGDHWNFMQWTGITSVQIQLTDDMGADETVSVNLNTIATTETTGMDETTSVNGSKTTVLDGAGSSESVSTSTTPVAWGDNWETMNWGGPFGG